MDSKFQGFTLCRSPGCNNPRIRGFRVCEKCLRSSAEVIDLTSCLGDNPVGTRIASRVYLLAIEKRSYRSPWPSLIGYLVSVALIIMFVQICNDLHRKDPAVEQDQISHR